MTSPILADFERSDLLQALQAASDDELDALPFGVMAFDSESRVRRYNRCEATMAAFDQAGVLGQHIFVELAPCLNNYLVAGRFEDARAEGQGLDAVIPYVLTFRMRPTRVRLRLLALPEQPLSYVLVDRLGQGS